MKYLTFKGMTVLMVALLPIVLKFKLKKRKIPVAKYPSYLAEAI
jgi:hypothetical protein